jgi:uncharacterized protein YcaQ
MTEVIRLTAAQARRMALEAQGFCDPRPTGRIDRRHLRRVLDRVGLIQIDSVNVLARSQELPLFARLGPHPRTLIPEATAAKELFEFWGHEAAHIPVRHHHLFRWRYDRVAIGESWGAVHRMLNERGDFLETVLERVRAGGPVVAGDLAERRPKQGTWWQWDDAKLALETLFWTGRLGATRRAADFARVYDLPERILPPEVVATPTPPEREARKELLVLAARSCGVATAADLADYYRQRNPVARPLIDELVAEGRLRRAEVAGWKHPAFVHPEARVPRWVRARALLSPFDSLIWFRDRTLRLWDFHYRIEIYVPAPKRVYGYYVLPFLLGDDLVARVDLKADRKRGVLAVQAAHLEPHADAAHVAPELAAELDLMAGWLGLDGVEVADRGDLAAKLRAAVVARHG